MFLQTRAAIPTSNFSTVRRRKQSNPIRLVLLGYLGLIAVGTLLLSLPFSQAGTTVWNLSQCVKHFFVATSAVCVTGLSPIDVGSVYSHIGHWILIVLMQCGGLGIMIISTTLILLAGMRPGFGYQSVFLKTFSQDNVSPGLILKAVLPFTFLLELFGAIVYFFNFPETNTYDRFFSAIFHTVSSFCNVGFSLYPDSLIQFESNAVVAIATTILVLAGGFGFLAVLDLKGVFLRKRLALHTKLALITMLILFTIGFVFYFFMEFNNAFNGDSLPQKILSAFFSASSSKTAGITITDISQFSAGSLMLTIFFMFIGANPGSCGGGIKTTTAAVIAVFGFNFLFRGRDRATVLGRTIPQETVNNALYIFLLGVLVIVGAFFALLITESGIIPYAESTNHFFSLLFEVVSAYSTCGLSLGATSELSMSGKLIICAVMFIGRLGPLFLISALASQDKNTGLLYSEENVMVG